MRTYLIILPEVPQNIYKVLIFLIYFTQWL